MNTRKFLFYLLAALLGGCVPVMSLHPLYTDKDIAFEEKLLGTWVDDNNETTWEFSCPNEPAKTYKLIFVDDESKKGSFDVYLTKLQNKLYLDVYPGESPWDEKDPNRLIWPYNSLFLIPAHTFIKIDSVEPQLKMRLTDDDEMEKLLKEDPNAVKHESVKDGFVLTASTKELQAFVLKYADDSRLFTEEIVLRRKQTKTSSEPSDISPEKTELNKIR
jgi:hypothetical protein